MADSSGALDQRVQAIDRAVEQLQEAVQANKNSKVGVTVLIVVVFVGIAIFYYNLFSKLASDELVEMATPRLEAKLGDVLDETKTLMEKSAPVVMEAFSTSLQKNGSRIGESLEKEQPIFVKNVTGKFQEQLDGAYEQLLTDNEDKLMKIAPDLVNDEKTRIKLRDNFIEAFQALGNRFVNEDFRETVQNIVTLWESFPVLKVESGERHELGQQMIFLLLDILRSRLIEMDKQSVAPLKVSNAPNNN